MKKFKNGEEVKINSTNEIGRVVRYYEKCGKYVVKHHNCGKLYTYGENELKLNKINWFKKLFGIDK